MFGETGVDASPVDANMIEEVECGLASLSASLAETIAGHPAFLTLIIATLASTAILSIGNGVFSRIQALQLVSDVRTLDDAWPKGSINDIASELRSNIPRTEKMIVILSGLGLANMVVVVWLFAVVLLGFVAYIFSQVREH